MTANTAWVLSSQALIVSVYSGLVVVFYIEGRRAWRVTRKRWLAMSHTFIGCGCLLVMVDSVTALFTATSVLRFDLVADVISFNLLNGAGVTLCNIGMLTLPMLWIEIGLAVSIMQPHRMKLQLTRRTLGSYLVLLSLALMAMIVLTSLGDPIDGFRLFIYTSGLTIIVIVVTYFAGARLLSAVISRSLQVRALTTDTDDALAIEWKPEEGEEALPSSDCQPSPQRAEAPVREDRTWDHSTARWSCQTDIKESNLQMSIVHLMCRIVVIMFITLGALVVFFVSAGLRSHALYYLSSTAVWLSSALGLVSVVQYSRTHHIVRAPARHCPGNMPLARQSSQNGRSRRSDVRSEDWRRSDNSSASGSARASSL